MGFIFKKKKGKAEEASTAASTETGGAGAAAASSPSSNNRRRKLGKKAASPKGADSPDTAVTEASIGILETLNVKPVADQVGTENDFEVFMGEYPEEQVTEHDDDDDEEANDAIKKQLFSSDDVDKALNENKEAASVPTKVAAVATVAAAAPTALDAIPVKRAATIYSQEVLMDGNVHDADEEASIVAAASIKPRQTEPVDLDETIMSEESTSGIPPVAGVATKERHSGPVDLDETVVSFDSDAASLPTVEPAMPLETRVQSAAEIAAVAQAIATTVAMSPRNRSNAGMPASKELEYEDGDEHTYQDGDTYEDGSLRNTGTWTTAGSTAARTYDPSVATSAFNPMNNSVVQSPGRETGQAKASTVTKVLDALGCGHADTTLPENCQRQFNMSDLFYDPANVCAPKAYPPNRPYFNEEFAKQFLQKLMTKGISVLFLHAPGVAGNDSSDWKGRTVTLMIEPGMSGNETAIQPKLEWTTVAGGRSYEVETSSLALLRILSIQSSAAEMKDDGDDDRELCFFTVTSDIGDVHIFEANTPAERDQIVSGLKNVIARLTFHLIAGDTTASSELYADTKKSKGAASSGELPSLANPHQTMNRIAHTLLA